MISALGIADAPRSPTSTGHPYEVIDVVWRGLTNPDERLEPSGFGCRQPRLDDGHVFAGLVTSSR